MKLPHQLAEYWVCPNYKLFTGDIVLILWGSVILQTCSGEQWNLTPRHLFYLSCSLPEAESSHSREKKIEVEDDFSPCHLRILWILYKQIIIYQWKHRVTSRSNFETDTMQHSRHNFIYFFIFRERNPVINTVFNLKIVTDMTIFCHWKKVNFTISGGDACDVTGNEAHAKKIKER